jgi:hypothetical protein
MSAETLGRIWSHMDRAIGFLVGIGVGLMVGLAATLKDRGVVWLVGGTAACLLVAGILAVVESRRSLRRFPGLRKDRDGQIEDPASQVAEAQRRARILALLRQKYLLGHDGLSPEMMAGLDPLPKDWVDSELATLGQTWRQNWYL